MFFFSMKEELSKIFKDFCGKFKDFSRPSHNFSIDFSGLFKDMMLFQGPCKPCSSLANLKFSIAPKISLCKILKNKYN